MSCPIVSKSLFSETERSTRLLLNSSDVYKLPARRTSQFQHGAFWPYPNDHKHKLAFIPSPRQTTCEYGLPIGRHWWHTCNGDCHWPRRGLSRMQALFSINYCKGKGSFYIAQYPVRWTAQGALHFLLSLADLFIPTPTRFSGKPSSQAAITRQG